MSEIHKGYNLQFVNQNHGGKIIKGCQLINKNNIQSVDLCYYLSLIQFYENIQEVYLPEVNKILINEPAEDISVESVNINLGNQSTEIEWNGRTESISTVDFKGILEEYSTFLRTPPLNGAKV